MHIEADNLLYGRYSSLLKTLRNGYQTLAATPLNANKSFITASVFWIANLSSLKKFNDFLLSLGHNYNDNWKKYLKWLRVFACCRHGGVDPDESGIIIIVIIIHNRNKSSCFIITNTIVVYTNNNN